MHHFVLFITLSNEKSYLIPAQDHPVFFVVIILGFQIALCSFLFNLILAAYVLVPSESLQHNLTAGFLGILNLGIRLLHSPELASIPAQAIIDVL